MSDRASLRLIDRAWHAVEAGELGAAFRTLWTEGVGDSEPALRLARAELQAFCGNEDAALSLLEDAGEPEASVAMVRARVAAARGDWDTAFAEASVAIESTAGARAELLRARAQVELQRPIEPAPSFEDGDDEPSPEALHLELLRARCTPSNGTSGITRVADRARTRGAIRVEAEAWTDLAGIQRKSGDEEGARASALRAVELWEDMAMTLPPPLRAGFWSDPRRQRVRRLAQRTRSPATVARSNGLHPVLEGIRQLTRERNPSKLLGVITEGAVGLSGAERGFVLLVDEEGRLEARTVRGAEDQLGQQTAAFSKSIAETVLIDREPVVTVDATHDPRVQDYMSVHQLMLKSVACLPIATRGRTWGVLYLEHRSASGRFSGADLSMLQAFADQAALAIETADLLARVERQKEELERTNEALRDANAELQANLTGTSEALERTQREVARLRGPRAEGEGWGLVGASEGMRRVYDALGRVSASDVPVVITGESGTGKELVAQAIHRAGARAGAPFISLNCGAIPESLLESELFGHVAGAFTGATRAHEGVFAQAEGGTLFMDEIADMPPRMQLDLLRVLQERRIRPVGASAERAVDVRIISASRYPLQTLLEDNRLREDLYYRLAVVEIRLPPLRERRDDIPLLCDHFLSRIAEERGEPRKRLDRAALQRLVAHDFPGNVRELEHLLINASVFASGDVIEAEELAIEPAARSAPPTVEAGSYSEFENAERTRILNALNAYGWNRARAARSLGMPRRTFYRRLKKHGIELPDAKA